MIDTKGKNDIPAALLAIDTTSGGPSPRAKRPMVVPKVTATTPTDFDPFSVLCAPPPPQEPRVGWGNRIKSLLIGKGLSLFFWHIVLPGLFSIGTISSIVCGGGAMLASWGGYKLHKAPDTEQGRAVARAVGDAPKPSVATRILEPVKQAAEKPVEVVKAGAKKAVEKAEDKAEELKIEVKEEAAEIKGALQGLKAKPPGDSVGFGEPEQPEQKPGLIAQAGQKLSDAKDAVAAKLGVTTGVPDMTPAQAEKQRDLIHRKQVQASAAARRAYNQWWLGVIGQQQMAAASALSAEAAARQQQQMSEAWQWQQGQVDQVNRRLRGQ